MAETLTLGAVPKALMVNLVTDADFVQQFTRSGDTPWPNDAELWLEFVHADRTSTNWAATLSNQTAVWNVDRVEVNEVIAKRVRSVKLWYKQGDFDLVWASGEAEVA